MSGDVISINYLAKNKKNSPKESINIKEFRPKMGIYLPVITCDVAMVTAVFQKIDTKKLSLIISTGKTLREIN